MPMDPDTQVTLTAGNRTATGLVSVDGYEKGIEPGQGPWRKVIYQVPWGQSDDFMDLLVGVGTPPASPGGGVFFPNPHHYPGNPNLVCVSAHGLPIGVIQPDAKLLAGEFCLVEAFYKVPIYDLGGLDFFNGIGGVSFPYSNIRIRSYGATEPLPPSTMQTKGGDGATAGIPMERKGQLRYAVKEITIELFYRPYLYDAGLEVFQDSVNADVFLGKQRGTVKFGEWDSDPDRDGQGNRYTNYVIRLLWRQHDWNAILIDDSGVLRWANMWNSAGNTYAFPYKDWSVFMQFLMGEI